MLARRIGSTRIPVEGSRESMLLAASRQGRTDMERRAFLQGTAAAGALLAAPAIAQSSTEISFYYPVAVGGPITKLIDAYAGEFEKDNPSIKVKPIYAGTYQETIVKALTAHKSRNQPTTSVRLASDRVTLVDQGGGTP